MYKFNVLINSDSYFTKASDQLEAVRKVIRQVRHKYDTIYEITVIKCKRK